MRSSDSRDMYKLTFAQPGTNMLLCNGRKGDLAVAEGFALLVLAGWAERFWACLCGAMLSLLTDG